MRQSAIDRFNAQYAACLDAGDFRNWPDFFLPDAVYRIQARENFDAGLPLCILALEGHGMLRDRIYGIQNTLFHAPYYQRHVIGTALLRQTDGDEMEAEANYAVFRTRPGGSSEVFNVGRYLDRITFTADGPKLAARTCVFDSELIPNSLIYPI